MAITYTEEQLNKFDKDTIVQLFLVQQEQLKDIDQKLQLLLEQVAVLNNKRFGKSTEKMVPEAQITFMKWTVRLYFSMKLRRLFHLAKTTWKKRKRKDQEK